MKYIALSIVSLSIFSATIMTSFAGGTVTKCANEPLTIAWTSASCPAGQPTISLVSGLGCVVSTGGVANNTVSGVLTSPVAGTSCSAQISCTGATPDTATVNAVACACASFLPANATAYSGSNTSLTYANTSAGVSTNVSYNYNAAPSTQCQFSCNSGFVWDGVSACIVPSCTTPWGTTVTSGNSVPAYNSSSVASPSSCSSPTNSETRTCTGGVLSGSFTNSGCVVTSGTLSASSLSCIIASQASSCNVALTWSTSNGVGTSKITSNRPAANTTIFTSDGLANQNVAISGAYPSTSYYLYNNGNQIKGPVTITPSCAAGTSWRLGKCEDDCNLPWGGSIPSGTSIKGYSASTINNPATCASIEETRICSNGTLSGTYTNGSCTVTFITGTLTVPASCTIPMNGSTCTVAATWVTSAATVPSLVDRNTGTTLSTLANQGGAGLTVWVSHPNTTFDLKDGTLPSPLDTATVSANCIAGTSWDAASTTPTCLKDVAITTFTIASSTMYSGASTMLNWTGVTGGGAVTCSIDNGVGVVVAPAGSITTGARTVDTAFTLTCTNGPSTVTKSVTFKIISGALSISPASCQIAIRASSCTVDATWVTTHTTDPKLIDMNVGLPAKSTLANRSTPFTVWIGYDHTTFNLQDGGMVLDTKVVPATLPTGAVWAGGMAVAAPVVSLVAANGTTSYGFGTTLTWTASDYPETSECHNATANWTLSANTPAQLTPAAGTFVTSPLSSPQTFTLACTGPAAPLTPVTATSQVGVCTTLLPVWNGSTCQARPIAAITLPTGNYTPSTNFHILCTNASSYALRKNGTVISTGPLSLLNHGFNIAVGTGDEGSYSVDCSYTSADNHVFTASSITIKYYSAPTDPIVSLKATPVSVAKGSATVLSWSTMFPGDIQSPKRTCLLTATPVCTGTCTAEQTAAAAAVDTVLNGNTDARDPDGANRVIRGATGAINVIAHPGIVDEWRALGKKTINLTKSMDFRLDCGAGSYSSSKIRVNVASSNEG